MNNGTGFNGCYASHIVLRKGTSVIKIPDVISDNLAASINCALATMVNCVSQIPSNVKLISNKALIQVMH
jgi:D-arabinose 1-dehydrogenase-like Zn-dependent alcohol dehydrogenase